MARLGPQWALESGLPTEECLVGVALSLQFAFLKVAKKSEVMLQASISCLFDP